MEGVVCYSAPHWLTNILAPGGLVRNQFDVLILMRDTTMDEIALCPTVLLDDSPANNDDFGSPEQLGPHQRVADSIADLIESTEKGGKVIGLEGGWGSGKSTVVSILHDRLSLNQNYSVIPFDAWAHEGDPLRRTYLETLIDHLKDHGWVDKKSWSDVKEQLAKRRKVTDTTITAKATVLGKSFAISMLLIPVGSPLLVSGWDDGIAFGAGLPTNWKFVLGIVCILAPFFVLLCNAVHCYAPRWRPGQGWSVPKKKSAGDSSGWDFLTSKGISKTRTNTIETPEPTSIEFQKEFRRLMHEALQEHEGRRVLLVLDNLDRVDSDNARTIWSTLQTFLHNDCHERPDWLERLWVIVPYDPNGIRRLWNSRNSSESEVDKNHEQEQSVSDSFLDKSFQIRFRVALPVLSDWKTFLISQIEKALPKHNSNDCKDCHLIYRVYDQFRTRSATPPTPRELKLYVNQIGALHRQWQHDFPVGHMAYYILKSQASDSLVTDLQNSKLPEKQAEQLLGENLQSSLAGLLFNVEADKGMEILLEEPIHDALVNAAHKKLVDLSERHEEGFWAVLEIIVSTKVEAMGPSVIANTARCLKESGLFEDSTRHEVGIVLMNLRLVAESVKLWTPLDQDLTDGIRALCQLLNDRSFSQKVLVVVNSTLQGGKYVDVDIPANVVKRIYSILEDIERLEHMDVCPEYFQIEATATGWFNVCEYLAATNRDGRFWHRFRSQLGLEEIESEIMTVIVGGQFADKHINTLLVTNASFDIGASWTRVQNSMLERLAASNNIAPKEAYVLLRGLCKLELRTGAATTTLDQLVEGSHIMHHFHRAKQKKLRECQALCAFIFLRKQPGLAKLNPVGDSDAGYQLLVQILESGDKDFANDFLKVLSDYQDRELLFKVVDKRGKYDPTISLCMQDIAKDQHPETFFTSLAIRNRWRELMKILNTEESPNGFIDLLGAVIKTNGICGNIQNLEEGFDHKEAELYLTIAKAVPNGNDDFLKWCKEGIEQLGTNEWEEVFSTDFACVRLVLHLVDHNATPRLATNLQDALESHTKHLVHGKHVPNDSIAVRWNELLGCIATQGTRRVLREQILEVAISIDGAIDPAYFTLYGHEISDLEVFYGNPRVVPNFFSPMLQQRNVIVLGWLRDFLKTNDEFLGAIVEEHVQNFDDRLREVTSDPKEDEAQPIIDDIASMRNIKPVALNSDDVDEPPAEDGSDSNEQESSPSATGEK